MASDKIQQCLQIIALFYEKGHLVKKVYRTVRDITINITTTTTTLNHH